MGRLESQSDIAARKIEMPNALTRATEAAANEPLHSKKSRVGKRTVGRTVHDPTFQYVKAQLSESGDDSS